MNTSSKKRVAVLHGAGYVGGELIRLLESHPQVAIGAVTSRTFAGEPVWKAHPALRGQTQQAFTDALEAPEAYDALLVAAEHGRSAQILPPLLAAGYEGAIVDLSADFRYVTPALYEEWFGYTHPAPALLDRFRYGLADVCAPYAAGQRHIANPGCFATGLALALWPLAHHLDALEVSVTALTGASGSGTQPSTATHFPTRAGSVRAYKVLAHQHVPEVEQVLGAKARIAFVPASGPWTRGIWGTAHLAMPASASDVAGWFEAAYAERPLVRLYPGQLPEMRHAVRTPFCDIGWTSRDGHLVVGFALDNLLKGAASQAVQNLNLVLGLPETAGLCSPSPALASV